MIRSATRLTAVLLVAACSSLADPPVTEECSSDQDCGDGFVCDQGRCLSGNEAAPRAHLGFDIRERSSNGEVRYRVEVDGCDCMVQETESVRELSLRRSRVSQVLFLDLFTTDDPSTTLPARFDLTQPSRFGQIPAVQRNVLTYPTLDADGVNELPTSVRWARYHPFDPDPPRELVLWTVDPDADLALRYLGVVPPRTDSNKPCALDSDCCEPVGECDPWPNFCNTSVGECTAIGSPEWSFDYYYEPACSRGIQGEVAVAKAGLPRLEGVTVGLRYADPSPEERFGIPSLQNVPLLERPPECEDDTDCDLADEICDQESKQCLLALAGRAADEGITTTDPMGTFRTRVYTYCDGQPDTGIERSYGITVTPDGPFPSVEYLATAPFFPGPNNSVHTFQHPFCVPDWGPATSLELQLEGAPQTLVDAELVTFACCDVSCLPATSEDLQAGAPPLPSGCDGRASTGAPTVRVSANLVPTEEQLEQWAALECLDPLLDINKRAGTLTRAADCSAVDAPCRADMLALGTAEEPRAYQVRVESPVGSVLGSADFRVELRGEVPEPQTLTLPPRALLTGTVDVDPTTCARREPGEDCAAREAVVLAERLRMPNEAADSVPGPYLHTVTTFYDPVAKRDGSFVLPLDRGGAYVVTALPAAGAEGGPGNFAIVEVPSDPSVPLEPLLLTLEDGVVVTLQLDQFDERTSVVPVDRGSYLADDKRLVHPGRAGTVDPYVDLNRVGECWTPPAEGALGCMIRRLIPPGSDLSRSQTGHVRFTARRSAKAECTRSCPAPLPTP